MIYRRFALYVGLPSVICLLGYVGTEFFFAVSAPRPVVQSLDYPVEIDLGTVRSGKHKVSFHLHNSSKNVLSLSNFRTSCGCMLFSPGGILPSKFPDQINLAPLESKTLHMQVSVGSRVERGVIGRVFFQTDDPELPEVSIPFLATIDVPFEVSPPQLPVGVLEVGETLRKRIQVFGPAGRNAPVTIRLSTGRPEVVNATFIPSQADSHPMGAKERYLIGHIEVLISATSGETRIDEQIDLYEEGELTPVLRIPVSGILRSRFVVSPTTVNLPFYLDRKATYSYSVRLSEGNGAKFFVEVEDSAKLTVDITHEPTILAVITWPLDQLPRSDTGESRIVRLRLRSGDVVENVAVKVHCARCEDTP